jgi:hypothetical protein
MKIRQIGLSAFAAAMLAAPVAAQADAGGLWVDPTEDERNFCSFLGAVAKVTTNMLQEGSTIGDVTNYFNRAPLDAEGYHQSAVGQAYITWRASRVEGPETPPGKAFEIARTVCIMRIAREGDFSDLPPALRAQRAAMGSQAAR